MYQYSLRILLWLAMIKVQLQEMIFYFVCDRFISMYISSLIVFGLFPLEKNAPSATVQGLNILAQVNIAKMVNIHVIYVRSIM